MHIEIDSNWIKNILYQIFKVGEQNLLYVIAIGLKTYYYI